MGRRIAMVVNGLAGPELSGGRQDATRIYSLLTRNDLGQCDIHLSQLIVDCDSRNTFQSTLLKAFTLWDPSDQLVLYYSGHGQIKHERFALAFGAPESSLLPFDGLMADLQTHGVTRAIILLDCCHSGAALKGEKGLPTSFQGELPRGIALLTSCRSREKSYELPDGSASIFTHLLAQAIETGLGGSATADGLVTIDETVEYINTQLRKPEFAKFPQVPAYSIHGSDRQLWLSLNPSKKHDAPPEPIPHLQNIEELRFLYEITAASRRPCPGPTVDDLDWELVTAYAAKIGATLASDKVSSSRNLGLYSVVGSQLLSVAAVVCFARQPHTFLPQARSVFVAGSVTQPHIDRVDVTGPLSRQVKTLLDLVSKHLEQSLALLDQKTALTWSLVIREAISNAIAHRDYTNSSHVRVAVDANHVEIVNPGKFPGGKSLEDLLSSQAVSSPADAAVAWYLTNLLAFEGVGRGLQMYREYRRLVGLEGLSCEQSLSVPSIHLRISSPTLNGSVEPKQETPPEPPSVQKTFGEKTTVNASTELTALTLAETFYFPEKLGRFRILARLGQGGQGAVYAAMDDQLQRRVAIKVLSSRFQSGRRFYQEARLAARVSHPNIAQIFEVGQENEISYIVMELITGSDFRQYLANLQPITQDSCRKIVRVIADIGGALAYIHELKVIHRDVKPSNIMIDNRERAVLMDFGIAKSAQADDNTNLTSTGAIIGTPSYMSPEQFTGQADSRSDIYSLGTVLYEALSGQSMRDLRSIAQKSLNELQNMVHHAPAPVRQFNKAIPKDLEAVCMKAVALSPEDRYQTAALFERDLRAFLAGSPVTARKTSGLLRKLFPF